MDFFLTELLRTFNMLTGTGVSHKRVYTPNDNHLSLGLFFFFLAKLRHSELSLGNAVFESGLLSKYSPCRRFCCVDLFGKSSYLKSNRGLRGHHQFPLDGVLIGEAWFALWCVQ